MLRDITIGQYFPGGSLLHRLDPRMKLVIIFAAIIFVFVASSVFSIGLMLLATVSLIFCTGISFKFYIRGLKPVFLIILLTSALNIFYVKTGLVLVHWKFITITSDGLLRSALIAVRIAVMILLSCVLTYTTSPSDLTDA